MVVCSICLGLIIGYSIGSVNCVSIDTWCYDQLMNEAREWDDLSREYSFLRNKLQEIADNETIKEMILWQCETWFGEDCWEDGGEWSVVSNLAENKRDLKCSENYDYIRCSKTDWSHEWVCMCS